MLKEVFRFFILGVALGTGGLVAMAVGDLIAFQPGTPIKSVDVNQNFSTLRSAIQALEAPINTARLTDNAVTSGKLASEAASLAKVSGGALTASGGNTTATGNLTVNGSLDIGYVNTFDIAGPLIQPNGTFEQTATCPAGTRVLGAGYYNSTDSDLTITHFVPFDGTSWFAKGVNNTATLTRLYIRLTCARL
jgi:hypothetical protein